MASRLSSFLAELKRRKVYHVAVVYVVVGVGVLGAAEVILDPLGLGSLRGPMVILVLLGFPIALVLAWAYEVTPEKPKEKPAAPSLASGTAAADLRKSIVVLPFDNMSPDPGDAYFADGLTEEIITNLSFLHSLRVISRNSAMVLKGTRKDTRVIAEELKVQYVLEGSVRKDGDELRITAQLIDAESDEHVWAEKYDGVLEDVFSMQEKVSRSIVAALELSLAPKEDRHLAERPIEDVKAYECYLRAREEVWRWTEDAAERAVQNLQNALEIVGDNAVLCGGLAYAYSQYVNLGVEHDEYIGKAEEWANRGLQLDPESAEAHLALGVLSQVAQGDPKRSIHHLRQSLNSRPDDPHALVWLSCALAVVGKTDEAYAVAEILSTVDPLTPLSHWAPGFVDMLRGRYEAAMERSARWIRMEPENPAAIGVGAFLRALAGRHEEACTLVADHTPKEATDVHSMLGLLVKAAVEGSTEEIGHLVSGDFEKTARRDPFNAYVVASMHGLAGLKEEAIRWAENAAGQGFLNYPLLAEYDPVLSKLRGEARYEALLGHLKHEWENLEV